MFIIENMGVEMRNQVLKRRIIRRGKQWEGTDDIIPFGMQACHLDAWKLLKVTILKIFCISHLFCCQNLLHKRFIYIDSYV